MNVLYISYDGALDPLGYSQIMPYLVELSNKGIKFTLVTYEKKKKLEDTVKVNSLKLLLANKNIEWEILRYHKSPTIPATAFDIIMGITKGLIIILRDRIQIIHARSFVGAVPAIFLAKLFNLKLIFDMRGFWADERVDGAIWKEKKLLYNIAKWCEHLFLLNADWVICLTEETQRLTREFPYLKEKKISIDVIPTCVDTIKFTIRNKDADLLRKFNLQNRFIFIYFGSIGTWYMLDEMIDFFKIAKRIKSNSFFLLLTPDKDFAAERLRENKLNTKDYLIEYVPYEEIPSWISLADASLSFIKPLYSKKSSCPTKFAESLACGIPVIINSGIGDTEKYVNNYNIGVIVERFVEEEYIKAVNKLLEILKDKDKLSRDCRKVTKDFFSLKIGVEKYWNIYKKLNSMKIA